MGAILYHGIILFLENSAISDYTFVVGCVCMLELREYVKKGTSALCTAWLLYVMLWVDLKEEMLYFGVSIHSVRVSIPNPHV